MTQAGLPAWSKTAALNSASDSAAPWPEGMAPSQVNDSARGSMASVAKFRDDNSGSLSTAGTSTAYTLTTNTGMDALAADYQVAFQLDEDCGTPVTLNVDSKGAKPLRPFPGVEFLAGALKSGGVYSATYKTSNSGEWIVHGPTAIAAGQVVTASIADANVTYAKIQNVATNRLLGNVSGGSAAPQEITIGSNLSVAGTTLNATANLVGPSSAVDSNVAVFDGTTGKLLKDSGLNLSGARVLLNTMTASSSSVLTDSTTFSTYGSTFDEFEIVFEQLLPATNAINFILEVSSASTFQTSGYNNALLTTSSGGASNGSSSTSFIALTNPGSNFVYNSSGFGGFCGAYKVFKPTLSSTAKAWIGSGCYYDSGGGSFFSTCAASMWVNASALDGFRIRASSGNIASGKIKVYGLK